MSAPVASYIRFPADGNYLGKAVRAVQRTIGADVTYAHVAAPISARALKGVYYFDQGVPSALAASAQDGVSTGLLWLQNPSASIAVRIRRLMVEFANATATAIVHDTSPRIVFARCTFTGTFSGATLTLTKRKTADSANASDIRTASTGATVTVGNVLWAPQVPANDITTSDVLQLQRREVWRPQSEDEYILLAQNECLAVYQDTNGTSTGTDQRLVRVSGIFDEVDVT